MDAFRDDRALLVEVLNEVGEIALTHLRSGVSSWSKDDGTPVSDADLAINRHLQQRLCGARPDYGWLSEETEDEPARLMRERVWVVDPIDGTRAFLEGVPHFCHAVALVEGGRPILAALYNPMAGEFYEAASGQGARLNGSIIHVSERREVEGCRMAAFEPMFRHPAWRQPWPPMHVIQRDSVAYRLALVASGEVDAALGLNAKRDWDLAAADLIVHEAGGRMTSHDGKPMLYNMEMTTQRSFLAAGSALYDALFARVGSVKLRARGSG